MDDLYRLLRNAHLQAQGVMDTVRDPLVVLDSGLCVMNASQSFFDTFGVGRDETIGQPFRELGNGQWAGDDLRHLLEAVIPRTASVID
jgi:PAS domain-containing protein